MRRYNKDLLVDALLAKLKKFVDKAEFAPESIGKVSGAARGLCQWAGAYTRPLFGVHYPAQREHCLRNTRPVSGVQFPA